MRTLAVAILFVLIVPVAAGAPEAEGSGDPDAATPTSMGRAIVGFTGTLPAEVQSDALGGLPILLRVQDDAWSYIVLAAPTVEAAAAAAQGLPRVWYVEDDVPLFSHVIPNDARYGNQYGPGMMGFPDAWGDAGYGSSDVVVAVLDTGIRRTHQDFQANRVLQGYDYVNNDSDPSDDCEHGTHVSGTVAATTNNGVGVAGMSQATILPYKVLSPTGFLTIVCSGSTSTIAQAILDAKNAGADIISMSLGGGGSNTLKSAVDSAWNAGVLLVAAAGNDGASNSVDHPAAYSSVIAVAALTSNKVRASYSDMGSQVEVAAPGSNVDSTSDCSNTCYASLSGTSMATPHVAGALALALSCAPSLSAATLRAKMQATAEDLGSAGRDTSYGYGLVRIDALVDDVCTTGPGNRAPTAAFTTSISGKTVSFDATGSSDPDGDTLTYAWTFGDGATATGAQPSHTYSSYGTYTAQVTVSDGKGASDVESQSITLVDPVDPDPATPNLESGVGQQVTVPAGGFVHRKIQVPSGATTLTVDMTGPACGTFGCSFDADLYVRQGAKPTTSAYDCRPYASGSTESCTFNNVAAGWYYVSAYGYSGSGSVTLTATHNGASTPTNQAPTASFSSSTSGLTVSFDGTGSSDPDGDTLSYAWGFGDGTTATGATVSHTYSAYGTYTVTLTVSDGNGGSDSTTATVTLTDPTDPDPSTPNLQSGQSQSFSIQAGQWVHHKIQAPAGTGNLQVSMSGPSCSLLSCSLDADLYVRHGAKATSSSYDCRPYQSGSAESCSMANPNGWYYVSVYGYSGSGTVTVTATLT